MRRHLGLYLHIPFCSRMCHYCDFVKTSRFDDAQSEQYFQALYKRTATWLKHWSEFAEPGQKLCSVFFGGGTPSLFTEAYSDLMTLLAPFLEEGAEVTLEANPEHIGLSQLAAWARLGVNRLSLGVQSFDERGLRFLTREHSPAEARDAVQLARSVFANVNVDLIYGWQGQSLGNWEAEIEQLLDLDPTHVSLYTLGYEGSTPLARRLRRGLLSEADDKLLESMYRTACAALASREWVHEEVSNWARPGFETVHNALYWRGESYLGIGSGAHAFLAHQGAWGLRWHQDAHWRKFEGGVGHEIQEISALRNFADCQIDESRDAGAWIVEIVSSGLRTRWGLNLNEICTKTGYNWVPRPAVREALARGLLEFDEGQCLRLKEAEWYRETAWSLEVILSFLDPAVGSALAKREP